MYIALATVFSRFDFQLYETNTSDVEMEDAYLHTLNGNRKEPGSRWSQCSKRKDENSNSGNSEFPKNDAKGAKY